MEYSSFILPYITQSLYKLENIQKTAIRCILKQPYDTSVEDLLKLANLDTLKNRLEQLNQRFLTNAITNKHELMLPLFKEYTSYINNRKHRKPKYATIFCDHFVFLKTINH